MSPNTYWSILKTFVNGSKIPLIPPLLVNNEFVTDLLDKANLFNDFFSEKCRPITNDSTIPNNQTIETVSRLSDINIDINIKLIRSLDLNKAHGDKKVNNYRPVSLLPICSKIIEKIIFNSLFGYLEDNELLNCNQSGFIRSGDSCVHQLLMCATHEIYKSFDANPSLEVKSVFFDISKVFDRVWHYGLLYKPKLFRICGRYYNLILSLLDNRHQRVVLNSQSSKWSLVEAGVPQAQFWVLYYSLFILMISHKDCVVMQNYLLMTLHLSQQSLVLQYHRQILMKT